MVQLRRLALLVALTSGVATAACSSSGGSPAANGPLLDALGSVAAPSGSSVQVEYGRPADTLRADGGKLTGAYAQLLGVGDPLAPLQDQISHTLGIAVNSATTAVSAGKPPAVGTLLSGADTSRFAHDAARLGAKVSSSGSSKVYRFRPDNKISFSDPLGHALPEAAATLDVVSVNGSQLRFGASSAALAQVSASSGKNLAGNADYAAVANCLGTPLAALLVDRGTARVTGDPTIRAIGAGAEGRKGVTPTEELCVVVASDAAATRMTATLKRTVVSGVAATTRTSWSKLLRDPQVVDVAGSAHMVKLVAKPTNGRAGLLLHAVTTGDLESLLVG